MHKELFEHLYNYMEEHNKLPRYIKEEVNDSFTYEDKLSILIGRLCIPENGGIETVMKVLGLKFDEREYKNLVYSYFDIYIG